MARLQFRLARSAAAAAAALVLLAGALPEAAASPWVPWGTSRSGPRASHAPAMAPGSSAASPPAPASPGPLSASPAPPGSAAPPGLSLFPLPFNLRALDPARRLRLSSTVTLVPDFPSSFAASHELVNGAFVRFLSLIPTRCPGFKVAPPRVRSPYQKDLAARWHEYSPGWLSTMALRIQSALFSGSHEPQEEPVSAFRLASKGPSKPGAAQYIRAPGLTIKVIIQEEACVDPSCLDETAKEDYSLMVKAPRRKAAWWWPWSAHRQPLVIIKASQVWGVIHAFTTLSQLIDVQITNSEHTCFLAPVDIQDKPRFPHRGVLLDTSRNYFPLSDLKRVIRGLAAAKLNIFHWHVIDQHSFPLAWDFDGGKLWKAGCYRYPDGKPKIYTKADVKELVNYAFDRGIQIIPEFDMPAHTAVWGHVYPEIMSCPNCTNWDGERDGLPSSDWSERFCTQPPCGQFDTSSPRTYELVSQFLFDMQSWFPSRTWHMGHDEVVAKCWDDARPRSHAAVVPIPTLAKRGLPGAVEVAVAVPVSVAAPVSAVVPVSVAAPVSAVVPVSAAGPVSAVVPVSVAGPVSVAAPAAEAVPAVEVAQVSASVPADEVTMADMEVSPLTPLAAVVPSVDHGSDPFKVSLEVLRDAATETAADAATQPSPTQSAAPAGLSTATIAPVLPMTAPLVSNGTSARLTSERMITFSSAITSYLASMDKRKMVWNEGVTEYGMSAQNKGLAMDSVVQVWLAGDPAKGQEETAYVKDVVERGYKVVLSLYNHWYLDCGPQAPWCANNGTTPHSAKKIHDFNPTAALTPLEQTLVMGGEVALWTEAIKRDNLDRNLFPRAWAAAERLWSPHYIHWEADSAPARLAQLGVSQRFQNGIDSSLGEWDGRWPVFYRPEWCDRNLGSPAARGHDGDYCVAPPPAA